MDDPARRIETGRLAALAKLRKDGVFTRAGLGHFHKEAL